MRLINTLTYENLEFDTAEIPPYAILSHAWEEDEFLFSDWDKPHRRESAGFRKLTSSCALAHSEGWQFIWIDTCCIDKSSSAELSEAINSMYQWYKCSEVCYVYLMDLSIKATPLRGAEERSARIRPFRSCKWFTRGWTLQELLAPKSVVFYDRDWIEIGSRTFLQDKLSKICNISLEQMRDPLVASVATKMSWMSNRKTKRKEDMAYCLLGLFGINMPLLYGEGENVFFRLQTEIIRSSCDESIFAWTDPDVFGSSLLARNVQAFRYTNDIVPIHMDRPPYYMTNKGLAMELVLYREPGAEIFQPYGWLTPLACARTSDLRRPFMIHLDSNGDTARRHFCFRWFFFDPSTSSLLESRMPLNFIHKRTFYVSNETQLISQARDQFITTRKARVCLSSVARRVFKFQYDQSVIHGASAVSIDGSITLHTENFFRKSGLKYTSSRGYNLVIVWEKTFDASFVRLWLSQQNLKLNRYSVGDSRCEPGPESIEPSAKLGESDNAILKMDSDEFLWLKTRREDAPRDIANEPHRATVIVIEVDITTVDRTNAFYI